MQLQVHSEVMLKEQRYFYEDDNIIASGSFGSVFRAYDQHMNRFVALKRMPIRSRIINAQLTQEIETLKQVPLPLGPNDDFNHLISYFDFFSTESTDNLVMELFDDSINLQQHLQNCEGKLPAQIALEIFHQICKGIKALHALKIVHRDIKPENILVKFKPLKVKVVDFGYAKLLTGLEQFQSYAGSPVYMSPQNMMSLGYDGKANDIWSLGILIFQMVGGNFPWNETEGSKLKQEMNQFIDGSIMLNLTGLQFDVKDLVLDCLQLQENDRVNIEQLVWKVESKLYRNYKTFDSSFKPLPQCSWLGINNHRPLLKSPHELSSPDLFES